MARGSRRRHCYVAQAPAVEDVAACARRLGITAERVLREYARIGFSDMSRIVQWGEDGKMLAKPSSELSPEDAPAIAEVVASASTSTVYRIKLHDKKPVLDALGRCINLVPPNTGADDEEQDWPEDPREFLIREVDRLAAEEAARSAASAVDE